jgi:hypothetical protein
VHRNPSLVELHGSVLVTLLRLQSCEHARRGRHARRACVVVRCCRRSHVISTVKTGAAGRYTVRLRGGTYPVTTPQPPVGRGLTPRVARVPKGRVARVDFDLDTGIQ